MELEEAWLGEGEEFQWRRTSKVPPSKAAISSGGPDHCCNLRISPVTGWKVASIQLSEECFRKKMKRLIHLPVDVLETSDSRLRALRASVYKLQRPVKKCHVLARGNIYRP